MKAKNIQITGILIPVVIIGVLFFLASNVKASTLRLISTAASVDVGQTFSVDVMLDTKGEGVDGIDLYSLRFDPKILEVVDSNPNTSGIQITAGTVLPLTLVNTANNTSGAIQFSQTVMGGTTYSGAGKLATVNFKAKSPGKSGITLDFKLGSTTDTNVAAKSKDSLTSVSNTQATVNGAKIESTPETQTPPPAPVPDETVEEDLSAAQDDRLEDTNRGEENTESGGIDYPVLVTLGLFVLVLGGVLYKIFKNN